MRGRILIAILALTLAPAVRGQQVVDRIVAKVNNDVITESQVRELGRFQKLVNGKEQTAAERLRELVEQWIVNREASYSGYHAPDAAAIDKAYQRLEKQMGSAGALERKMKAVGLSKDEVRKMLKRQLFLSGYLDYKFRPEVQVSEKQIEEYYHKTLVPELKREGQKIPSLESVADRVREVLVERGINRLSAEWLDQMRDRWKVEKMKEIGGTGSR